MDKPLSQETQSQIRALCESIARRDELRDDVREELHSHVEEKVIGYLAGREEISECDAVLLAREHFGKPETLRRLLQAAHPLRTDLGLFRRIAVVIVATLAAQAALRWAQVLGTLAISAWLPPESAIAYTITLLFDRAIFDFLTPLCALAVLVIIGRPRFEARREWFASSPKLYFGLVILASVAVWLIGPVATITEISGASLSDQRKITIMQAMGISMWIGACLRCAVWMWWCDSSPRTAKGIRNAAIAWGLFEVNLPFIHFFLPWPNLVIANAGLRLDWILRSPGEWIEMFSPIIVSTYIQVIIVSLFIGLLFAFIRKRRPEFTPTSE